MNEQVQDAIAALAEGWTVEIDRSRPGAAGGLDGESIDEDILSGASHYELRVYRMTKTARDSGIPPHSISAIDAAAARDLLGRGATYVGPTRNTPRSLQTLPALPPVGR